MFHIFSFVINPRMTGIAMQFSYPLPETKTKISGSESRSLSAFVLPHLQRPSILDDESALVHDKTLYLAETGG